MQTIKIDKITSKPTKTGGTFTIITDDKGAKFSGFDVSLSNLKKGDIIEAEIIIDGNYHNIQDGWELTKSAMPEPVPEHKTEMSKDDWAEKDRVTRKSIERQKSLEMAVELAKSSAEKVTVEKIIATAQVFEAYLENGSLKPKDVPVPIKEDKQAPTLAVVSDGPISNEVIPQTIGELYTAYLNYFSPEERRKINAKTDIANFKPTIDLQDVSKAWKEIKARKNWK